MLREYALEPLVLTDKLSCKFFLDQLGVEHGRLIAELPRFRKWARAVYEGAKASGCGDVELKYIEERLSTASEKFLLRQQRLPYDGNLSWIDNAEANAEAVQAIICTANPRQHPKVIAAENVDETEPAWAVHRQVAVPCDGMTLAKLARPLFEISELLVLVDPYVMPSERRWRRGLEPLINGFFHHCRASGSGSPRLELHRDAARGIDESTNREQAKALSALLPEGERAVIHWWGMADSGDAMHPRYVLTDRGGLQVDRGLDYQSGKTTPVVLMSSYSHSQVWDAFHDKHMELELADRREVIGQGGRSERTR